MMDRNSHLAALGMVRNPFPYTPDAGSYFLTAHLQEQCVELAHCIEARKGFCLLTAEVGMGKSTLVRRLMRDLQKKDVQTALVFNTFLQGQELLAAILHDFGLQSGDSMSRDIAALNRFLLDHHRAGKTCLLIIDDAQNLTTSSLELIRLLCNLETDQEKLLQILLAGQPELEQTLSQHSLRQLRSRVAKHARLRGLSSVEMASYVKFRCACAGSDGLPVLQADACQLLWKETQGVPRRIHVIMDRCLYGLAFRNGKVIDLALMRHAITDSRVDLLPGLPMGQAGTPTSTRAPRRAARRMGLAAALLGVGLAGALAWHSGRFTGPLPWAYAATRAPATALAAPGQASAHLTAGSEPAPASPPSGRTEAPPTQATQQAGFSPPLSAEPGCANRPASPAGHVVVSQPLSDTTEQLLGQRLARLASVCAELRQGATWLTWDVPAAGDDLTQPVTAAQLQIALSRYGSLPAQEVDGLWGPRSQQALLQFQAGLGLPATGRLDALSGLILEKLYVQER